MHEPVKNPVAAEGEPSGTSDPPPAERSTRTPIAEESYLFEAFVSYRHSARDRGWAKWLHVGLESYRVPDALVRRGLKPRIGRVFRDEEEFSASTSLSEQIEQALRASRHLIVVCSRATPASRWVNEEVLRFRQLGREQRIRVLLVDGEPHESFPPALYQLVADGLRQPSAAPDSGVLAPGEPLAADVRPQPGESARLTRRLALLRLVAPLLGCRFDDLRQRESERALRRLRRTVAAAMFALAFVAALAAAAVVQRNRARQRLMEMLAERGREEWLGGSAARALPFLASAYELAPESPTVRLLLAQALPRVLPRLSVPGRDRGAPTGALATQDGSRLLVIGRKGRVSVWDLTSARLVSVLGDEQSVFEDASSDGLRILTRDPRGAVALWDAHSGDLIKRMGSLGPRLFEARLSGDATRLVASHDDGLVETWDVGNARRLHAWRPHPERAADPRPGKPSPVWDVGFSPDGSRIVTVGFDGMVRLWDAETRALIASVDAGARTSRPLNRYRYKSGAVKWAEVSPDGTRLVTLTLEGAASVWDATSGRYLSAIEVALPPPGVPSTNRPEREIFWLQFSGDGRSLLVTAEGSFHLWDFHALRAGTALRRSRDDRTSLSHSGRQVVTASDDGLRVWDLETGELTARIESPSRTASFSADDRSIVSTSGDGTTNVWPLESVMAVVLKGHKKAVHTAEFSLDSRRVVTASADRTAKVWEADTGKLVTTATLHDEEVIGATLSPQGARVVSTSLDGVATIAEPDMDVGIGDLVPPEGGPDLLAARFLPDGRQIVSIGRDRAIRVWDAATAAQMFQLPGKALACPPAPGFSADGRLAVTKEADQARIWSTADGTLVSTLPGEDWTCAAFSRDGRRLVTKDASAEGPIRIWDSAAGRLVSSFPNSHGPNWVVAFSPDNAVVATAFGEKGVKLWDVESGRMLADVDTQRTADALDFTADARFLVTAGERGANLWDSTRGTLLAVFAPDTAVLSAAVSPDGTRLVTTGADGRAMIWRIALESRTPAEMGRLLRCYVPWRLQNGALVSQANAPAECSPP